MWLCLAAGGGGGADAQDLAACAGVFAGAGVGIQIKGAVVLVGGSVFDGVDAYAGCPYFCVAVGAGGCGGWAGGRLLFYAKAV